MRKPTDYTDDPLEDYRERATSKTVQALQWDGSPSHLLALGSAEAPAIGSYLVCSPGAVAVFTPEEFQARFERLSPAPDGRQ